MAHVSKTLILLLLCSMSVRCHLPKSRQHSYHHRRGVVQDWTQEVTSPSAPIDNVRITGRHADSPCRVAAHSIDESLIRQSSIAVKEDAYLYT